MDDSKSTFWQIPWDSAQGGIGHPWLVWISMVIFTAGLFCDLLLAVRLFRADDAAAKSGFLRVATKPWGLGEVGMIAATVCALLVMGSLLLGWLERAEHLSDAQFKRAQLFASILVIDGLGFGSVLLLLRVERIGLADAFGMRARNVFRDAGQGLFWLLAAIPPVWALAGLSQYLCHRYGISSEPQEMAKLFLHSGSPVFRASIAFLAVVGAPLFEETFFRGLAYPALKQKIGVWPAILATSLLFAAIHLHAPSFLPLCALAVGLTLVYEATGSLTAPIVMHSLFNLMTIVVMVMVPE